MNVDMKWALLLCVAAIAIVLFVIFY